MSTVTVGLARPSLSRRIHDGPLQSLGAAWLVIELVTTLADRGAAEEALAAFDDLRALIAEAVTLLHELVPDVPPSLAPGVWTSMVDLRVLAVMLEQRAAPARLDFVREATQAVATRLRTLLKAANAAGPA